MGMVLDLYLQYSLSSGGVSEVIAKVMVEES